MSRRAGTRTEDVPTLRLVTLRGLVRSTAPPIVFDQAARVAELEAALRLTPTATAIIVDGAFNLVGTVRLEDLPGVDRAAIAVEVMARGAPVLDAESDIDAARHAMRVHASNRVVIVSSRGELLGVLTEPDLTWSPGV